ncbi:NitT/TauT family transport system substrate-binding protein [Blastococcus sp. DSM 46786]|uniref:ABC transporter substrate-binding protein n=1 Tax=Blastococcus sp. DSM 46786 TaxID=1798227 RepID=UPI0008CA0B79|nr:ABC transporter substrate-binding protein [Blastococcus sp. DSM 46786]SEK56427.1 NitT/TauT family transport system substrate-binding protein [Blastococcus sp. DSM 46786]
MTHAPGRRRRPTGLALGCAAVLLVAACSSSGDAGGAAAGGGSGPTGMTVGYFPLVHTATAVHAEETGLFDEEGIDVTLEQTGGGAQAIPLLIAGDLDVAYGNYTSALLAAQQGLPVRILAGNDVGADDHAIMVAGESRFQEPGDLAGARVAVNNLQNIGTVAVRAVLEEEGVDPADVSFVELPYPEMQAALDSGAVDAIWQVEPFQASALAGGHRILFPLFSGPVEGMPVAGWLTTEQFVRENPEAVAGFRAALADSAGQLQGDRERLVELVPTYTQVPAEVVEQVALPEWEPEVDAGQLQEMADLMLEYGIIDEEFDVTTMIAATG